MHRRFLLSRRPFGEPVPEDFTYEEVAPLELLDDQFRVANHFISLDPAMRGWMTDLPSYIPPVELGAVMRAFGAGEIIESRNEAFPVGAYVTGLVGVQSHCVSDGRGFHCVSPGDIGLSAFVGPLGVPGLSAYFGLLHVGKPEAGQTVLVSGASGAVGSIVGQIAKLKGCRVIGIAGGAKKCAHLVNDLGFDGAIDYKAGGLKRSIRALCPDGIDVYFDNVGGEILNAALGWLSIGARVVVCGAISQYNAKELPPGPSNYLALLVRRARMEGFIVLDYLDRAAEATAELAGWIAAGNLQYRETIVDGLETFPDTFMRLFTGEKLGKLSLRV